MSQNESINSNELYDLKVINFFKKNQKDKKKKMRIQELERTKALLQLKTANLPIEEQNELHNKILELNKKISKIIIKY